MLNFRPDGNFKIAAGFVALILLVGHWFPWSFFLAGRKLPRLLAYTYGGAAICAGYTLWDRLNDRSRRMEPLELFGLFAVGGTATAAGYGADVVAEKLARVNGR